MLASRRPIYKGGGHCRFGTTERGHVLEKFGKRCFMQCCEGTSQPPYDDVSSSGEQTQSKYLEKRLFFKELLYLLYGFEDAWNSHNESRTFCRLSMSSS